MKLKTLHITNAWHPKSGGIGTFYRALLRAANELERQMVLVVPGEEDALEPWGDYAKIYHVKAPKSALFDTRYRLMLPHLYIRTDGKLRHILELEAPDVVEVCDKYSLNYLAGYVRRNWIRGLRRPLVVGLSCERMDDNFRAWLTRGKLGRMFVDWYMRVIYFRLFDEHIANSEYTAEELHPASVGHNVYRGVHVLPMGVDRETFHQGNRSVTVRHDLYREFDLPDDAQTLLYAGRLSPEKNVMLLADMMTLLAPQAPRAQLLIAGAGPDEPALRAQLERNARGRYRFLGHMDASKLASLIANVDLFVHPNPKEPFGIAPLEAMSSGTPVLAPDRGGVTSYANPGNAWVVAPEPQAFAAAALEALSDSLLREIKTERALATAESLTWPRVARMFFDLYDQLYPVSVARQDTMPAPILAELRAAERNNRV